MTTTMPATHRVTPDGSTLLRTAQAPPVLPTRRSRLARAGLVALLGRLRHGRLDIVEDGRRTTYGDPGAAVAAEVVVHDPRAWTAIATEGSIGLGRGFIEGWWHSESPEFVVRVLIANIDPIDDARRRVASVRNRLTDPVHRLLPGRGRDGNREDIASHYDIGNAFFALFLDDTMSYSAAVFADAEAELRAASLAKYDRILDKLGVAPGHEILEIGTGWGGFALRAAGERRARVTTTTISSEQHLEAGRRVADAGLSHQVDLRTDDWRDLSGTFDRVVSIEMIEAVHWRDYPEYFRTIERCLRPDGMVGLQAICVPGRRYEAAKRTEDFIRRFVFPGGMLPSIDIVAETVSRHTRLHLLDVEDLSAHYAETLRRWRASFDANEADVRALGLDERFCRLWRFYLAYCEAGFTERQCTVNQFVLAGPQWRPGTLGVRPT